MLSRIPGAGFDTMCTHRELKEPVMRPVKEEISEGQESNIKGHARS